jgi:D-alanyl-D-alanine carboxypeptidase/D-alanyl-D-alanine-endopeptidase (penicillin-binding protein 4)
MVKDAQTGKVVLSFNSDKRLIPGSTLKLFVTAAALSELGPEHRFVTVLHHDGVVAAGRLKGSLVLRGGGDPTLGSDLARGGKPMEGVFAGWRKALADKGIDSVEGGVLADNSIFEGTPIPGSWGWEDSGNYYAAPADGLSINDNLYRLSLNVGARVGEPAAVLRVEPEVPDLVLDNRLTIGPTEAGDNGFIHNVPGSYRPVLRGSVPAGAREFVIKGALPEPALFAAQAFASYLKKSGVRVLGQARLSDGPVPVDEAKVLARTESVPLREIVRVTNKRSFNFYAEMLSRAIALRQGRPGSVEGAGAAVNAFLRSAGIPAEAVRLADACGLSRLDLATAAALTDVLVFMSKSPAFSDYQDSLVFPGDLESFSRFKEKGKGTLLESSLRIKTGSLSGARSYAGYLKTKSGRLLAFAFIVDHYAGSARDIEKLHADLLLDLAQSR